MTTSTKSLAEILADELSRQNTNRQRLAAAAGLPRSAIDRAFTGTDPQVSTLAAILRALGKPWSWLDEQGFEG